MMAMKPQAGHTRPMTMLIAALGGEGGGLLADWVVAAARLEDVPVQSTSIPGVAQRTGATTYYIEMMKQPRRARQEPVFGLYPAPGNIDLMVASELVEAGRALENGFVTPDRTTLLASTHRVYAIAEKSAMADGAFDAARVLRAADELAKMPVLHDFRALALSGGHALNAVMLGAIAASGLCPLKPESFSAAIKQRGVAVDANLAGFAAGEMFMRNAGAGSVNEAPGRSDDTDADTEPAGGLKLDALENLPAEVMQVARHGVERLVDYQDEAYAGLYLDRLEKVLAAERKANTRSASLTRETARWLALWMAYEDVMRVAELKSRSFRYDRIRRETAAKPGEPIHVREFLKPGIEEFATVLPRALGMRLVRWAQRRGLANRLHFPLHLRSDTILGYLRLRMVAALKGRRRHGLRYAEEQALIERWLDAVVLSLAKHRATAKEIIECGRLIKGYGSTRARAFANFNTIVDEIVMPGLRAKAGSGLARKIADARKAALADEEGSALAKLIEGVQAPAAKKNRTIRRKSDRDAASVAAH